MTPARPILIAGGGIGGLATALALARAGVASRVLEREAAPVESGAGIQLGPNGMAVLARLGVASRLDAVASAPRSIAIFDGPTGRTLTELPLGPWMDARHGAPYRAFHRADLQAALLDRARETPLIDITLGFDVTHITQEASLVTVASARGEPASGAALVGADGLWSRVRGAVSPTVSPFARRVAARALIDATQAEPTFTNSRVGVWLAPRAHVVHYPVRAGRQIAVVVVFEDTRVLPAWDTAEHAQAIAHTLSGFASEMARFASLAPSWRAWSLFDPAPLARWTLGRMTLMGDAAHPILPFLAQGGALALEDAHTLAAHVARDRESIPQAFAAYEHARRPRAARVQKASRRNGRIYHLAGPWALARNVYLRARAPERLMQGYDWLYGWRPEDDSVGA